MKFEVRHDCHIFKNQIWLRVTVSRILFNSIQKFVSKSPTRSPNERKECVTHHESVPRLGYLSNWSMKLVILVPRGCAPPTIAVQHRKFAIHGLYVKPEKSDWLTNTLRLCACLENRVRPEVAILGGDQKERGLWGRECSACLSMSSSGECEKILFNWIFI